jgi:hypothetical protein
VCRWKSRAKIHHEATKDTKKGKSFQGISKHVVIPAHAGIHLDLSRSKSKQLEIKSKDSPRSHEGHEEGQIFSRNLETRSSFPALNSGAGQAGIHLDLSLSRSKPNGFPRSRE